MTTSRAGSEHRENSNLKQATAGSNATNERTIENVPNGRFKRVGAKAVSSPLSGREHQLAVIVESEIIPRLMLAASETRCSASNQKSVPIGQANTESFAGDLLTKPAATIAADLARRLEAGLTMESLYLDLVAPAARHLGVLWERDDVSFIDVTLAMSNLRQVLNRITPRPARPDTWPQKRMLLAPTPGEQHAFGLVIVASMMTRGGWDVDGGPDVDEHELFRRLGTVHYAAIGFSLANDSLLDRLTLAIASARKLSRNRRMKVLVGGRMFAECPELYATVGADAAASDPREALRIADGFAAEQDGLHM